MKGCAWSGYGNFCSLPLFNPRFSQVARWQLCDWGWGCVGHQEKGAVTADWGRWTPVPTKQVFKDNNTKKYLRNRSREDTGKDTKITSVFLQDHWEEAEEEWRARRSVPTPLPHLHWIRRYPSSCTTSLPVTACQPPPTLTACCLQVICRVLFNFTLPIMSWGFFF